MNRWSRGQSVVEFALLLPILLLFLFGFIDFGLAMGKLQVLNDTTRQLARSASIGKSEANLESQAQALVSSNFTVTSISASEGAASNGIAITTFTLATSDGNNVMVTFTPSLSTRIEANTLQVEASYNYIPITPIVDSFAKIPLYSSSQTLIEVSN